MNIFAEIEGIDYKIKLSNDLKEVEFRDFNINTMPASCLVKSRHYNLTAIPTLKLTSSKLTDKFDTSFSEIETNNFFAINQLNSKQIQLINNLVSESRANGFELIIQGL